MIHNTRIFFLTIFFLVTSSVLCTAESLSLVKKELFDEVGFDVSGQVDISEGYEENIDSLEIPAVDLKEFIVSIFEFLQNIIGKESEANRDELHILITQKVTELIDGSKKVTRASSPTPISGEQDRYSQEVLKGLANIVGGVFNIALLATDPDKNSRHISVALNHVAFMIDNIVSLKEAAKQQ